jgi:hypothetical protein
MHLDSNSTILHFHPDSIKNMTLPGSYELIQNQNVNQIYKFDQKIDEDNLFISWWSIIRPYYYIYDFLPSRFPSIFYIIANIILLTIILTIGFDLYILYQLINDFDEQSNVFFIYINITDIAMCLVIFFASFASTYTNYYKKVLTLLKTNNNESRFDYSISDQKVLIKEKSFLFRKFKLWFNYLMEIFWKFFCFTWLFTLLLSVFYIYVIPAIHPDFRIQSTQWLCPIFYPGFFLTFLQIMYCQIFWITCYRLEEICKLPAGVLKKFNDQFVTEQSFRFSILEEVKTFCKQSLTITEKIGDNIICFTTILFIISFNSLIIPIDQLKNLWKNFELTPKYFFALVLWISVQFFVLSYSLFRAIKIPVTYSKSVKKFRINFSALTRICHSRELEKEVSL